MHTMNAKSSRFWPAYITALLLASLGCIPSGDETEVDGEVGNTTFEVQSASADRVEGGYVVTLADTPEFSCSASSGLPMNYLQVVISDVDAPGTFDAEGRVFFNVFENGVSEPEVADSGTFTVDSVSFGYIDGSIDASGPVSSVAGGFSAEICN